MSCRLATRSCVGHAVVCHLSDWSSPAWHSLTMADDHDGGVLSRLASLRHDPDLVHSAARALVESHFPPTVAPDVLAAVGLDPDVVLYAADLVPDPDRHRRTTPRPTLADGCAPGVGPTGRILRLRRAGP